MILLIKINPYKSITLLPIIHDIKKGGGGTALYRGSHHKISYWIHNLQNKISLDDYIAKTVNDAKKNDAKKEIMEATGEEGGFTLNASPSYTYPFDLRKTSQN